MASGMRPILPAFCSLNHIAPSGPAHRNVGDALAVVTAPAVVMRPIAFVFGSVNHSALSAPFAMPALDVPTGKLENAPDVVTRPIATPDCSVNQSALSGPVTISVGPTVLPIEYRVGVVGDEGVTKAI